MNIVPPRLAAAAASTRTPDEVLNERMRNATASAVGQVAALFAPKPQFGSIARVKFDERELFDRVQKAINELELALGAGAEFSDLMASTYSSTLDSFRAVIHDECCTEAAMLSRLEDVR